MASDDSPTAAHAVVKAFPMLNVANFWDHASRAWLLMMFQHEHRLVWWPSVAYSYACTPARLTGRGLGATDYDMASNSATLSSRCTRCGQCHLLTWNCLQVCARVPALVYTHGAVI